jgi:hypothetical protein
MRSPNPFLDADWKRSSTSPSTWLGVTSGDVHRAANPDRRGADRGLRFLDRQRRIEGDAALVGDGTDVEHVEPDRRRGEGPGDQVLALGHGTRRGQQDRQEQPPPPTSAQC